VQEKKRQRRVAIKKTSNTQKKLEDDLTYLKGWMEVTEEELHVTKQVAKTAFLDVAKKDTLTKRRLKILKGYKIEVRELQDSLAKESHQRQALERLRTLRLEIKRERAVGCKGGSGKWPVRIVLLICELLVNGTPLSAVPAKIRAISETVTVQAVSQKLSVNYVRQCRVIVQHLNEMLAAFRLGNAKNRKQVFTDGTTCRQIAFQNLVIGIFNGGKLVGDCFVLYFFLEDEISEQQVKGIKDNV